jgi:hypothetical protein
VWRFLPNAKDHEESISRGAGQKMLGWFMGGCLQKCALNSTLPEIQTAAVGGVTTDCELTKSGRQGGICRCVLRLGCTNFG